MQSVQPKYQIGMTVSACIWLSLFPLLQGGTYARITYDKWIIMLILTGVTLLCFFADLIIELVIRKNHPGNLFSIPGNSPAYWFPLVLASALLFWTILSCLFSSYQADTYLLGKYARYEGLLTQLCYFTLFCCFFFSRVSLKPVLYFAAVGVTVFFVIVMLQRAGLNPFGLYPSGRSYAKNPEFQGTIGNIDMGTGYLLILSGLFLHGIVRAVRNFRSRKASSPESRSFVSVPRGPLTMPIALAIAFSLTIFLIITMDVQFGAVSLAVLIVFTILRFLPKQLRFPLLIFLVIIVLLVVWFWPGQTGGVWELHEILHGRCRLSFGSDRVAVWLYSLGLAHENLLWGGGSGTFPLRFNQYLSDHDLVIPKEQDGKGLPDYFDNPHNEYIQQLTDHGLPAMALFLVLLLFAVFRRNEAGFPLLAPCSAAVLCYAVQAFFSFSVCIVAPVFWVVLGLSFREE